MNAESLAKRIQYIFILCLFAGLCGLGQTIVTSLNAHFFTGIPLSSLLVIAEGLILWLAFKSDSLEKALNQISTLKMIALVLAAYSTYSLIMYFVGTWGNSFNLFGIWFQSVHNISSILASLAVFFTAATLKVGDTKKFNTASAVILLVEAALVFCITVASLIVSEMLIPTLFGIAAFIFMFSALPKLLGNKIVKGAIIGGIIAGDVGAVVGAIAASNSEKKK